MATTGFTKNFVAKNGVTTGNITLDAASGNISGANASLTGNLSVTGKSNLGNISNVNITGGATGQYITTDGFGNLSFGNVTVEENPAPMPTYVAIGDELLIEANYQGLFGYPITVDGTLTVEGILFDVNAGGDTGAGATGATGLGSTGATGLGSTGATGATGYNGSTGATGPVAGSNTQVVFNDAGVANGSANLTFDKTTNLLTIVGNIKATNFVGTYANGNSNINIVTANGNVTVAAVGNTTLTISGTGVNVAGTFNATGNTTLNNLSVTGVVSSNLIPASNGVQSLGNATNLWSNLYLSGNTIYLDSQTISATETGISMGTGNLTGGNITTTGLVTGALIQTTTTSLASNTTIATSSMAIGPITIPTGVNATVNTSVRWVIF